MTEEHQDSFQSNVQSDITHQITPMEIKSEISNKVTQSVEQRVGYIGNLDTYPMDWHTVRFEPPFPNNWQVVVLAHPHGYENGKTPTLRIFTPNHAQFRIRWEDSDVRPQGVGWVAYGFPKG